MFVHYLGNKTVDLVNFAFDLSVYGDDLRDSCVVDGF